VFNDSEALVRVVDLENEAVEKRHPNNKVSRFNPRRR
jgi:hypothetical protein